LAVRAFIICYEKVTIIDVKIQAPLHATGPEFFKKTDFENGVREKRVCGLQKAIMNIVLSQRF